MHEERCSAGVFRAWCEGWDRLPGDFQPWGLRSNKSPTRGGWALNLAADVFSAEPMKPLHPAELRELLRQSGLTDDMYRAGLAALEVGALRDSPEPGGISDVAVLGALAGLRVQSSDPWNAAGMPDPDPRRMGYWSLADEAAHAITCYWLDVWNVDRHTAEKTKVQRAASTLADALRDTGYSQWLSMKDAGTYLDFQTYLLALAEDPEGDESRLLSDQGKKKKRVSRALRPFVLRYVRKRMRHELPEHQKTGFRYNQLAAFVCSVILAAKIKPNDVANAIKNSDVARRYWLG